MRIYILLLTFIIAPCFSFAQDLNAQVRVIADRITDLTDKSIFKDMEKSMTEFLNNRKWTSDKIANEERITCNFVFIMEKYVATENYFEGSLQLAAQRPVFGSSYNTPLINLKDEKIQFKYSNFTTFDYIENQFTNNLSSILSFYALTIVGLDYASFGQEGSSITSLIKAQQIVNAAQSASESGWQAFEGTSQRNRYWLIENIMNARYKPFFDAWYGYHRKGLDKMTKNVVEGRKEIYAALENIKKVFKTSSNLYLLTFFFTAKGDEIMILFKEAPMEERTKLVTLLTEINNQNSNKWQTLITK
jgi:hypothetical protein